MTDQSPLGRARTNVTFHLPFDSGLDLWREPPSALATAFENGTPPDDQIVLQRYAPELRDNLLRRLPHKIWETAVEPPPDEADLVEELEERGLTWTRTAATVSIWNGGAGLLVLTYDLGVPGRWTWDDLSDAVDRATAKVQNSPVWTAAAAHAAGPRMVTAERATFWWCHRTVSVELDDWDDVAAGAIAETFVWNGDACDLGEDAPRSVLRFGLTACHVTHIGVDGKASAALERMVSAHTSVWQTLHTCELQLLEMAAEWRTQRNERPGSLRSRMDELLGLYESMLGYTSSLRDVDVHLSSLDKPLWEALSSRWGLERRLDGIEARLRTVRDLYTTAAAAASGRQAQRFTYFAWVFTLLGAVSTCLAVVGFVAPEQSLSARLITVVATICAVGFAWLGFWSWQRGASVG